MGGFHLEPEQLMEHMTAKWVYQMKRLCYQNILSDFRQWRKELKSRLWECESVKNLSDKGEGWAEKPTIQSCGYVQVAVEVFIFAIEKGLIFPRPKLYSLERAVCGWM